MLDLMFDEIKIVQKVDHSHITRVFETCEDDQNYYIVMEFVEGGTLTDLLEKKSGSLEEQEACNIVRQILLALNYMHQQKIVHRDMKTDNVLCIVDKNEITVKLADFGFATAADHFLDLSLGTPEYMAPEIITVTDNYDCKVDIWSLGIITFRLLHGVLPFKSENLDELRELILNTDPVAQKPLTDSVQDFIQKCLCKNPNNRPTAEELLEHEWILLWKTAPLVKNSTID